MPTWHAIQSKRLLDVVLNIPIDTSNWTREVEEWPKHECQSSWDDEVEGKIADANKRPGEERWSEWSSNSHLTLQAVLTICPIQGSCTIIALKEN